MLVVIFALMGAKPAYGMQQNAYDPVILETNCPKT